MERHEQDLLYLLSCFLNKKTPENRQYDWAALYPPADINDVASILNFEIRQLDPASCPDGEQLEYYKKSMALAIQQYEEKADAFARLEILFAQHNIDYLPVKGVLLAEHYPVREFRTSGDIDLIVRGESMDSVYALFCAEDDIAVHAYNAGTVHAKVKDAMVEIHCDADVENAYFSDIFTVATGEGNRFTLGAYEHLLYVLCHLLKHMSYRGAGIRMLMDLDVAIRAMEPFDEKKFLMMAEQAGVRRSAELLFSLVHYWFDTPVTATEPLAQQPELVDKLAEVFIKGGSFGGEFSSVPVQYLQSRLADGGRLDAFGKVRVALSMAFPDRAYLKKLYRYYERHSVLYPVAVCNRLWDSAFRRRGSSKKALRQIMSGSESSRLQLEVMKELGITE